MQGVKNPDNDIDKLHFLQEKSPRLFVQTGFGNSANRLILITMNRPQLVLVPPPPSLPLDVPRRGAGPTDRSCACWRTGRSGGWKRCRTRSSAARRHCRWSSQPAHRTNRKHPPVASATSEQLGVRWGPTEWCMRRSPEPAKSSYTIPGDTIKSSPLPVNVA